MRRRDVMLQNKSRAEVRGQQSRAEEAACGSKFHLHHESTEDVGHPAAAGARARGRTHSCNALTSKVSPDTGLGTFSRKIEQHLMQLSAANVWNDQESVSQDALNSLWDGADTCCIG